MAYPDLYSDETIVLNAQNIKVKSVSFEAVLTTRRLILVDSKKHLIAPQEILLATLRDIEVGENAIRDPTITLSIITNTGATRQMILTFSKTGGGGERRRECDEWMRVLRQQISSAVQHPIMPDNQSSGEFLPVTPDVPFVSEKQESTSIPVAPAPKKKIEIARPGPIKKIVETTPAIPKPVETTTLPTGSFCNRCGSRVPPESAFCNKCGTPVVTESDIAERLAAAATPPAPSVPQVQVQSAPAFGTGMDKKERPIEEVIHSIEPLIEDSVPRTEPAPLVPKQYGQPVSEPPVTTESPVTEDPAIPDVKWPVITSDTSRVPGEPVPAESPPLPPPIPMPPGSSRRKKQIVIGLLAVIIIVIAAAAFILVNPLGNTTGTSLKTNTPETTAIPTIITTGPVTVRTTITTTSETIPETTTPPTTNSQIMIPGQGVFVRILYTGQFKGSLGTPNNMMDVADKGERLFQIPTTEGIVVASIQKMDGSSDKLTVEIYKNGKLMAEKSTVSPKAIVDVQADLKPTPTPTLTATPRKTAVPSTTVTVSSKTTTNMTETTTH